MLDCDGGLPCHSEGVFHQAPKRKKTEVFWSGITGLTLTADTDYNLVALLKALPAPAFGTLAPFFNTVSDKLNAYNDNASLMFKLNLAGLWSAATETAACNSTFSAPMATAWWPAVTPPCRLMWSPWPPFFSIDRDGGIVTNGTSPIIRSNNGSYAPSAILLIAEQNTRQTLISAVVSRLYHPFTGALKWHLARADDKSAQLDAAAVDAGTELVQAQAEPKKMPCW